jgi:hypothetical protein
MLLKLIRDSLDKMSGRRKYGILAFVSLIIPGLGQIIKNEAGKGMIIIALTVGGWIIFFEFISVMHSMFLSVIIFLALTILWIWNVYDAYVTPSS